MARKIKIEGSKKKATVDDDNYAFLSQYKWRLDEGGVYTYYECQKVYMHSMVMALQEAKVRLQSTTPK